MSSFQDAAWLRRLWSLAAPGPPKVGNVENVQLVQDRAFGSSRERAPYAAFWISQGAPGAGVHNYIEIGGSDGLVDRTILLHYARHFGTHFMLMGVAAPNGISAATRVAQTLVVSDSDPELTPTLFAGNVATANIPAAFSSMPASNFATVGVIDDFMTEVPPLPALHFALAANPSQSIYLVAASANEACRFYAAWQTMRT